MEGFWQYSCQNVSHRTAVMNLDYEALSPNCRREPDLFSGTASWYVTARGSTLACSSTQTLVG
jgi:hypothetical protein